MNDIFNLAFNRTMDFEGRVLETVPNDPGGTTFWGISKKYNPLWEGWAIIEKDGPLNSILCPMVMDFYKTVYWNRNHIGEFKSQQLAAQVFDACVNLGSGIVIKALQTLVDVADDGIMGFVTIQALNQKVENEIVNAFIGWRKLYYQNLVVVTPAKREFLAGWLSRCELAQV